MHRDIESVIAELQRAHPGIVWEQLRVAHPGADDNGLWFFTHPEGRGEVQVESSTGAAPFLVEGDEGPAATAHTHAEAIALVAARLGLHARTG